VDEESLTEEITNIVAPGCYMVLFIDLFSSCFWLVTALNGTTHKHTFLVKRPKICTHPKLELHK
jgi:hypothetical protein